MNRVLQLLCGLVCAICMPFLATAQAVNPYLQAITPNSIVVNWKTNAALSPQVRFGLSPTNLDMLIGGSTQLMNDVNYNNDYYYHTVKLHGLQPATKYYYRVLSGTDSSAVQSFRTLPVAGAAPNASNHLRFLILGDNQIKAEPRYDSLMMSAKRKMTQLYGANFNDSVSFILNLGDQVDVGTLDHYEHVHLDKSKYLSGLLPIQTAVGNHETYGTLKMQAYYDHFFLDSMQYKGIYSGSEEYYAFQAGNMVIIYMNTESSAANSTQFNWVKRVIDTLNNDASVKWFITIGHRPYQAEQYVGDISTWVRNTVVPYALQSPKYFMNVGAHHHLYARGQMENQPAYNIISGGTAWNQYWGMATEQNFDDVQKTISNWAYQLVDVDMANDKVSVVTYSIGSIYGTKDNVVIDSFYRSKQLAVPNAPQITNTFPDSLQLPVTLTASAFASTANEQLNSTEFQVAADRNFGVLEKKSYRHYEDLFGTVTGSTPDTTKNQNLGLDITQYTVPAGAVGNGWHYVRARYRDRNQSWSAWSVTDSFKVYNSVVFNPAISLDTNRYGIGDTVRVAFSGSSTNPAAWIGIYRKGESPSTNTSVTWKTTNGNVSGVLKFNLSTKNEYYAALFQDGGYTEIAPRVPFYYGPKPTLTTAQSNYNVGTTVPVTFSNAPAMTNDWIGIYKVGMNPGTGAGTSPSVKWSYVGGSANGTYNVSGLAKGYYFATYLLKDAYFEATERTYFSVGDSITTLTTDKSNYNLGEYIGATWVDGPGNPKDWLGIYGAAMDPNTDDFVSYTYIDGLPAGSRSIPDTSMPNQPGNYFIVLFTNDSYNEVSNRVYFQMISTPLGMNLMHFDGKVFGFDHLLNWEVNKEEPGDQFTLQYSTDAKHFTDLYHTTYNPAANGKYEYMNKATQTGNNFYRLQMRSADGTQAYSEIVKIHRDETGENKVSVYPNPAQNGGRSMIESPYPIEKIEVADATGRTLYQSRNVNDNKFSLLHQDLPPGTYFIKIYSRKLYTAKLVITQ
ncbi:fibronectin type III domain-containing protein [Edaphocola flava]|uniref:fibronectin type III domain-containing protein n=1 Tax=Edaphocola flava TaxID=2499629 RepID=UPI00100B006F|nr:fibronectin type III domain-containing protein [Edaphocola flava]